VTRATPWAVVLILPFLLDAAIPPELHGLLKAVEAHYNGAQSLRLDFTETYAGVKRPLQTDSGVLYLKKPGRMRWDYTKPAGKIFLSDGKDVFLYAPGDERAEKSRLKESEDVRAPLAFLLGKLDFEKEFKNFAMRAEGNDLWITAEPKSANLAYTKAEFLVSPNDEIHRVRVTLQDQSKLDFAFANERDNVPLAASMFRFQAPPGVPVVADAAGEDH
jgi:outer membrane lipoprotein carrier protein